MELHNLLLVLTEHRCKLCTIHAAGYSELQFPTNLLDFVDRFNCWECFWNLSLSRLKPGWAYHCIFTHQRNYYVAITFLPAQLNWTCLTFRPKSKSNVLNITFQDYQGIRNYLNQHFGQTQLTPFSSGGTSYSLCRQEQRSLNEYQKRVSEGFTLLLSYVHLWIKSLEL